MRLPSNPLSWRAARLFGATLVVAVMSVVIPGGVVHAHTAFAGSTPSDGDVVDTPVSLVTLVFTGESEPADEGFVVLDAAGVVREPTSVSTLDDKVFTLAFDPPLAGGEIGVRWSVRAPDAHPIDGAFSFTVTAPGTAAAATVTATPATPAPASTAAATAIAAPTSTAAATAIAASTSTPPDPAVAAPADASMSHMSAEEMARMDEFLAVDTARPGESQATLGRLLSFAAIALALGGVAFTATSLRAEAREIGWILNGVKIAGVVITVGAVIEYGGVVRIADDSLAGYWTASPGFAAVLRMLAGVAIAAGFVATTVAVRPGRRPKALSAAPTSPNHVDDPSGFWNPGGTPDQATTVLPHTGAVMDPLSREFSTVVEQPDPVVDAPAREPARRWIPDRLSALGFIGCGAALISFWFDGHTVSRGFRPLHALANSVHVFAGSVWVGGVVAMAALLWSRHRRGVPARALQLVIRFSSVATVALAAVVVAGLVMAVSVLGSFGDLTGTQWGQVLLLKTAAVGLALVPGAYNHFRLLPALEADPSDRLLHEQVRSVVTAEAILLMFVVITTAWLVSSAA